MVTLPVSGLNLAIIVALVSRQMSEDRVFYLKQMLALNVNRSTFLHLISFGATMLQRVFFFSEKKIYIYSHDFYMVLEL